MTIRIINPEPDPSVIRICVCRKCGVKLEYVPLDIQKTLNYDYTGDYDEWFFIQCPKCSEKIQVKRP